MNNVPERDIAELEARLRQAAVEGEDISQSLGEPLGDWRHRLLKHQVRYQHTPYLVLLNPGAPSIIELLAYDQDNEHFLTALYHHLLGREVDPEGRIYYLQETEHFGRLFVLLNMLNTEPVSDYLNEQGTQISPRLLQLAKIHKKANRVEWRSQLWQKLLPKLERRWQRWLTHHAEFRRAIALQRSQAMRQHLLIDAVAELDQRQMQLQQRQQQEHAKHQGVWQQLAYLRRHQAQTKPADADDTASIAVQVNDAQPAVPSTVNTQLDAYYLAFEDTFRGEEHAISAHLERYRSVWVSARQAGDRALDLGCGRGEWLRMLTQAGYQSYGIDLNSTMVAHCQEQGFNVTLQDALAALRAQPDNSHALITGFHIAEHLPFNVLFELVGEAFRVLAPGGSLVLETPNPENLIVASYSFYHDLTHRNPLTPVTLEFLYQFHGYTPVEIKRFNPPPEETRIPSETPTAERLNHMLCAPMDYAVVGTKAHSKVAV
ncbi:class I SAM-dependent methyltransferase [Halomonas sp.]|uniref:class I SAM-dependent methyltransferase n=1 Tax=Halomonas sp. TaxID=1486246 RepID=UPI003A91F28B